MTISYHFYFFWRFDNQCTPSGHKTSERRCYDVICLFRYLFPQTNNASLLFPLIDAVSGGSIDYAYEKLGVIYSYALELRDRGQYGFVLPANQIRPSGEETSDAFLAAVLAMK